MKRLALAILLSILATAGAVVFVYCVIALPQALTEYLREPEDVYSLVIYLVVLLVLVIAWLRGALRVFGRSLAPATLDRPLAWAVVALGAIATALFLLEPMDRPFAFFGVVVFASGCGLLWISRNSAGAA
jgi:hypothetical protein